MVSLKHLFQSAKADGSDATVVKPSNWNEEHKFETAAAGVVLGRAAGAGAGPVQELNLSVMFPTGCIMMYGGATAPAGWLLCDGQNYTITTHPGLYAVLGTNFRTNNQAPLAGQFFVPDLRGRVPAGLGGALFDNMGFTKLTIGGYGGISSVQLSNAHIPAHTHPVTVTQTDHTHGGDAPQGAYAGYGNSGYGPGGTGNLGTGTPDLEISGNGANITVSVGINTAQTATAHNNIQPTLLVSYIIKDG